MKLKTIAQRFLVPGFVVTLIYFVRYRCLVSPRAEVELTPNLRIGRGSQVSSFVKIKASKGKLIIGVDVDVGSGCFLAADAGGVTIGDHTMIGPNVTISGVNYRYERLDVPIVQQGTTSKGIRIGEDVWIGAGVVILDGAVIGDHCIISPNSVVGGTLESGTIAQGQPARSIFTRR
ncbi:MAG: acyltransferase [Salinisphaera sp.]|uniref:acyltransferase n=1 Tax=Salinisphaera sp. TaxID=1914330 RepID=UPI003C7A8CBB